MSQPPHLSIIRKSEHAGVRNQLLSFLSDNDYALIQPYLEAVDLERGAVVSRPNEPFEYVYFPEHLVTSVVATTRDRHRIEVGIFGREGVSGTSLLLGVDRTPHETFVQVPGPALRIRTESFQRVIGQSASLHQLLLKYVQVFNVQVAQTALSHGGYSIPSRLARWLLMCHDRLDGNNLHLVHDFLALMLGVRRSGVTEQLHVLEGVHAISAKRGVITIKNRGKLLEAAGESYGVPEAEYERLIGPFRRI
ncbi:Crp/Fnr family transcriptional regulator [Microvirga brassicacearum]|uniref:Crp/Fnr family transcriptional regulator n=1 Tax=Microvirga brassicacearum TaxID=2580413 RepID=A0A5N3P8Z9_9HYPH|nr:Crp/Fnr family transcriptional regulator [Microvirga brassicacearum]KAB0266212.1 Crp/Fnr family transcriptional regulator [Microvirga brassicacearum]